MAKKPLDGIRVIELSSAVAGPTCGWILADLGADVVKVESPKSFFDRNIGYAPPSDFVALNRNKKSLAIDLKHPEGKEIFQQLVKQSDVLMENFGPGALDRLGFSYDQVNEINERIIYCSIKGYGQGPHQNKLGYDMAMQAETGLLSMTGTREKPMRTGTSAIDMSAAIFACLGIVLALRKRDFTNKGSYEEIGLFETACFLMSYNFSRALFSGESPPPLNEAGFGWAVYDIFASADNRKIFLGVTTDDQWQRFCVEFGLNDLLYDRFSSHEKRLSERPFIIPYIAEVIAKFPSGDLMEKLERARVICSYVNNPLQALEHPHLTSPHKRSTITYAGLDKPIELPRIPLVMDDLESVRAPQLGEDTEVILRELGFKQNQIASFLERGVAKSWKERE